MLRLKFNRTKLLLGMFDAVLLNAAILLSFWLRFEGDIPYEYLARYLHNFWWVTPVTIAIFYLFGLYNRVWEYASVDAGMALLLAVTTSTGAIAAAMMITQQHVWPRSVIVLTGLLCVMLVGGSRFSWRVLRRRIYPQTSGPLRPTKRVLIYGAGNAGATLAARMLSEPGYDLRGFIDDDPKKVGLWLRGRKVLGTSASLRHLVQRLRIEEVVIAVPSASGKVFGKMIEACGSAGVPCRTLPSVLELVDGRVGLDRVRNIDMGDLLAREPAEFEVGLGGDYLRGARVLVTGAGGSIGCELCRQICRFEPKDIVLLGRGENRIHRIYTELTSAFPNILVTPVVCSFTHAARLEKVFREYRPDIVFHAGANKHVYLMENDPEEAIFSNVVGTFLLTEAASRWGVKKFVLISTDKAVHPTTVMGATKRLAEIICHCAGRSSGTQFMAVRFGNVIGSDGSVTQVWRQQLAAGKPLTVTHPEVTRYFMTVPEAALLVIYAGAIGAGGETFLLDMGEPLKIAHLAREFLRLAGYDGDLGEWITFTKLRPGEKLHETLTCEGGRCYYLQGQAQTRGANPAICEGEVVLAMQSKHLFAVACRHVNADSVCLQADVERLRNVAQNGSSQEVKAVLHDVLPEYVSLSWAGVAQDG